MCCFLRMGLMSLSLWAPHMCLHHGAAVLLMEMHLADLVTDVYFLVADSVIFQLIALVVVVNDS